MSCNTVPTSEHWTEVYVEGETNVEWPNFHTKSSSKCTVNRDHGTPQNEQKKLKKKKSPGKTRTEKH